MSDKAVIYARYSSDAQRDASIDQQVKICQKYAEDMDMEVLRIYDDRALTGKTDKRPSFLRMIRDSAKQEFKYVIVYTLDRFSRNKYDSAIYKHKLKENGIKVLSAMEHITDDPTGALMESILEGFAQYYSDELSQKINRGLHDNAEKCIMNGRPPLGYQRGPDGHAEIVEEEAEIVREIFRRVNDGEQIVRIIEDLNKRCVKTKYGGIWNKCSFSKLLSNERYTGVYIYQDHRVEGGMPAIIDKQLFDSVQSYVLTKPNSRKSTMRRHCNKETYLLTGKLFCGECESYMTGISGKSQADEPYYYYQCTKKRYEKKCHKQNVRRDYIEREITATLRELLDDDELLEWLAGRIMQYLESERNTAELEDVRNKLAEATRKRDNLLSALENGDDIPIIKERLKSRQDEVRTLSAQLSVLEKEHELNITKDMIETFLYGLRKGDLENKDYQETLINSFLVRAYLFDNGELKMILRFTKEKKEVTKVLKDFARQGVGSDVKEVRLKSPIVHSPGSFENKQLPVFLCAEKRSRKSRFVPDYPFPFISRTMMMRNGDNRINGIRYLV